MTDLRLLFAPVIRGLEISSVKMNVRQSDAQRNVPRLNRLTFSGKTDLIKNEGRFGPVFKAKLDGKLNVAVKRVAKKKTRVAEAQFFFNTNGHPNVINFYCLVTGSDSNFM